MKKILLKKCEVCGSKSIKLFQKYGRVGSNYNYDRLKIFICLECNHRFQNPRYPNQFFIDYYLKNYRKKKHNNILIDEKYLKSQEKRGIEVFKFIKDFIKKKEGKKRILDHGSALGHVMIKFKENGWNCLGIDPNIESINSKHKIKNIQIDNYFGENLPKYEKPFDLILSLGSLEHAYDISSTLKNIKKNLSFDGIFFIRWRSEDLMGSPLEYFNFNHLRYFSIKSLKKILFKNGFEILKETKKPIEFCGGYTYFVCKRSRIKKNFNNVCSVTKNTKEFLENYYSYLSSYYNTCVQIKNLNLHKKTKNYKKKINFVKKNNIGLLSKENSSIDRFINESQKFLKFINNSNIRKLNL